MPLSEQEKKLCRLIEQRRSALLEDLRLHVGLPTGMNNTPALDETRERFMARCRALGAECELIPGEPKPAWLDDWRPTAAHGPIPPTAVCTRDAGPPDARHKAILLSGHLDTVHHPAGAFKELSIAPDGKTATGPGCVDMKGGLVIAMAALEALAEAGIMIPWTFMLNSDEETGSYHSDAALRAEAASGHYRAAIALEPAMSKGELAVERGGSGQFMLDAYGRAAHVGRDFTSGVSAVDLLARSIIEAGELTDPTRGVIVNVGPVLCMSPPNVVAPHAKAWGNVRFVAAADGDALLERLEDLESGADEAVPRVRVATSFNRPAKPRTAGVERLALLARQVSEDLGRPLPFARTAGVCDGNNLQDAGEDLPVIDTLGVRGGGLHTPTEWIELASLVERCTLLAVLLARLSGQR